MHIPNVFEGWGEIRVTRTSVINFGEGVGLGLAQTRIANSRNRANPNPSPPIEYTLHQKHKVNPNKFEAISLINKM